MARLTAKNREAVQRLLSDYDETLAIMSKNGKKGFETTITVAAEDDGNDYTSVEIDPGIARSLLIEHCDNIVGMLRLHGIEVA